ncbi:MAG: DUF1015 domain-containing protein [Myxococcota bacterium]
MSIVRPFPGLRPPRDKVSKVVAPPYDVVSSAEARAYAEGNPLSFFHISRPEIDLPGTDEHAPEVYQRGRENMLRFKKEGVLTADPKPCFYLYRQKMGEHVQTGLVAAASVDEYQKDLIKKHELTRADKEDDRTQHIDLLSANDEPVFLTYPAKEKIDGLVDRLTSAAPTYEMTTDDGIEHTFWVVGEDEDIAAIRGEFGRIEALYVADGHHRSAAASRVRELRRERAGEGHTGEEEYNFFLAVIFPHDQMHIMDYNRVVKDLRGLSKEEFLGRVGAAFDAHRFCMYLDGSWYSLYAKEGSYDSSDPVASLDVAILQDNLLRPVLGIENPRTDKRIDFVGGIRGTKELEKRVDSGEWAVAFSMFPTSIEELMAIADAGKTMPPKSTWFEPKLRSGLVVHEF